MESEAGTCAVHTMTLDKITVIEKDIISIHSEVNGIKTDVATMKERIDWVKAIVWLVFASLAVGIINIILTAAK